MRRALLPIAALSLLLIGAAGCPTVDLGEEPPPVGACRPDRVMFEDEIWPNALDVADDTNCVAADCHAQATGRSALRLIPDPMTPEDFDENYDVVIRFLNCGTPRSSKLITKPAAGEDPHGGGDQWTFGTAPETLVEDWIETAP